MDLSKTLLAPLYSLYEDRLARGLDPSKLPEHVAVILDGHRRYARSEGLGSYSDSYTAGMRKFEEFLGWAEDLGIPNITGWLLSKENLRRPEQELEPYFDVLVDLLDRLPQLARTFDLRLRFVGSLDLLPSRLVSAAKAAEQATPEGSRRLTIAMGYGGRQEIVDACRELVDDLIRKGTPTEKLVEAIDAEAIAAHLYSVDVPDPDLVIRTSGASRLSGFLLWQSAYAEFAFVDVFWPAFRRVDLLRALRDFTRRERRFGQ